MRYANRLGHRGILVLVIVGLAAGSVAATRWTPWSPLNSCLLCETRDAGTAAVASAETERSAARTNGARPSGARHTNVGSVADASSLTLRAAPLNGGERQDAGSAADGSRHEWQPWSAGSAFRGAGGAEGSAVLGGLSRLMSMSISGGGSAVHATAHTSASGNVSGEIDNAGPEPGPAVTANAPPAATGSANGHGAPAPHPTPNAGQLPPGPGGFTPSTSASGGPGPTEAFHEHDTPTPAPFVPAPPSGPLSANDRTGTLTTGGSPSPTPEPGSMILLGTGLVAVLGEVRRRRRRVL